MNCLNQAAKVIQKLRFVLFFLLFISGIVKAGRNTFLQI